ncbi:hypothetical protein ACF0H5_019318 [Mactra antiquata]
MDYSSFFNKIELIRKPSALRDLYDGLGVDMSYVLMAGGLPNPAVFPISGIELTLSNSTKVKFSDEDMHLALQYGITTGHPELIQFIKDLTKRLHDPPTMNDSNHPGRLQFATTAGSQDGIFKTLNILLENGDTIITEENVYPNLLAVVQPLSVNIASIKTDRYGIVPESLEAYLSQWPKPEDGRPSKGSLKILYCVPNGDNPTGIRYTTERKQTIYRLAQEYNFLILEDDAYYFLEERPFTESFLSMDVDGRVIRLETFSKTIAPGLRLGYIAAPEPIWKQFKFVSQASTQGSSSLSQFMMLQLIRKWGVDGYLKHCDKVNEFYAKRRLICEEIARRHLDGLAEWTAPSGGMFLWITFTKLEDSLSFIMERLVKKKVLIVAGAAFHVDTSEKSAHARIAFSMASEETMEKGFKIIAEELREVLKENGE